MMKTPKLPFLRQRGFTLVEAILVMVITGILAGMVAVFIRGPVQNYVDSAARAELTDTGEFALRRMARDLRAALPNSVRVNAAQTSIEFFPAKTGGRYLAAEDEATFASGSHPVLDFTNANNISFTVIGAMPTASQAIGAGDMIAVYNLGPGYAPADAYGFGTVANNIAVVAGIAGNIVTMTANPYAQTPPMASPGHRFQVVTAPVTYYCSGGTLWRVTNYGVKANQIDQPAGSTAPSALAKNVKSCEFDYTALANVHDALIGITIVLQRADTASDGPVTLHHQIHVDNTP
jgi:MSHA biogenesis protein MshO